MLLDVIVLGPVALVVGQLLECTMISLVQEDERLRHLVSNALVPTEHMPALLQDLANWNPVSAVTAACRQLFGNPNPSASIHVWPMQHPILASLLWSAVLVAVFAPLASSLYRRRTTD